MPVCHVSARLVALPPAGRTRSMWGLVPGCTSSRARGLDGSLGAYMDVLKRRSEIPHHFAEARFERRRPPHQHIIVANAKRCRRHGADQFAQAPPHAVAFHGITDLL